MGKISITKWDWECDTCGITAQVEYGKTPSEWFDANGRWGIFKTFCSKRCLEIYLENEFIERNKEILKIYDKEISKLLST